jgi:hypothetical protein
MSSIFVWNTWSTDSTVTVVPDWGIAKTSTQEICPSRQKGILITNDAMLLMYNARP